MTAASNSSDWMLSIPNANQSQTLLVDTAGTGTVSSYTLVYDVYVASGTAGGWIPFLQADTANSGDGDLFGKIVGDAYGIGIGGNYQGAAPLDAWNRIAFTISTNGSETTIGKYINGELIGTQVSPSASRYAIDKAAGFLIFSDEDGETSPVHLSNFAVIDKVLTSSEIATLGGAAQSGIFSTPTLQSLLLANGGSEFRFGDGSLAAAIGDAVLTPRGQAVTVETPADAGIPALPAPDYLLSVPAGAPDQMLKFTPGGTGTATAYTIAFDLYVASGTGGWIPFFQSDAGNGNDADLFGKVSGDHYGIGIGGNYQGEAQLDAWNRIAFTVEVSGGEATIKKYINGELVGTQTSTSPDRYTIDKAAGFLVFTDEDGETTPVHVSNFAYVEMALNEAQVKAVGGPSADGIVPTVLQDYFVAANGTEIRFAEGTATPALGTGTLTADGLSVVVQTPTDAGVPVVTAPVAPTDPAPIHLGAIADMMVTPDAETVTIDLSQHFTKSGLTFTVTNSDGDVLAARLVDGHTLEIDPAALGHSDIHVSAVDGTGQVYEDDFRVRVAGPNAYTIAVLPDTQDYVFAGAGQKTFNAMTQWLADHAEALNLKFVTSVGDVTSGNTASEWAIAKEAFSKLNGIVPYAMLPGNHDQGGGASDYSSLMTSYFSVAELQATSNLGGIYDQEPGETKNAWYTFEGADGTKWINVSMEFGARDDVLRWAGEVLDAHSDYRAIITTHHYTNMGTRADNYSGPLFGEGTGKDYGIGNSAEMANDGEDMWQELVSTHPNVSFVFSGHVFGDGAETIVSYNDAGKPVYQMFVNYQNGVSLEPTGNGNPAEGGNGGNGAIRIITIDPDNDRIDTETYLAAKDEYITGSRGAPEPSRDGHGEAVPTDPAALQPVTFDHEVVGDATSGVIDAPRFDASNGLKVTPGFAPKDGGDTYDAYTLVYDMKLPSVGQGGLASIFQSDLNNLTDGDLWLNISADHAVIGTNGQDEGYLPLDQWMRVVITLERVGEGGSTFQMNKYVDGVLQGTQTVGSAYSIGQSGFLIFADDSFETPLFSLSSFAFVETALTAAEVAALGGPTAAGPFTAPLPGVNMTQFDFSNGTLAATYGNGTLSQQIGSGGTQQLTGELREHQETIHDGNLGTPTEQFVAKAGDDQTVSTGGATTATVHLDGGKTVDKLGQITRTEWLNEDGDVIATKSVSDVALSAGVHHLTLKVSDANGVGMTDTVTVAVTDGNTLLHDTFDDGNANGWTAPGARWQVAGSALSRDTAVAGIAAPEAALRAYDGASGIMRWTGAGSTAWSDYTVSATLTAEDQKGLGLVAYYKDASNYYRLSFDIADNTRSLVKVQNGVETVLATETATSPFDRAMTVELAVNAGKLVATLDGEALFGGTVLDGHPLSGGTVGVYSEGQRQVIFDDIFVHKGTLIADAGKAIRVVDTDGDGSVAVDVTALASSGLADGTTATWSEKGTTLANGLTSTITLDTGKHVLHLDLDGTTGKASDTVTVEVVKAEDVLVHETFADGVANGFRFVDEGELGTAAAWSVVDGVLQQTSNRYSRELGGNGDTAPSSEWSLNWSPLGDGIYALRKGTYAVYEGAGSADWKDYSVETTFTAKSSGAVGLLLHYQDANNYYKFELDNNTGLPQLFSLKNGIEQTLWQGVARYDTAGANLLRADIVGGKLQVWLNGTALFTKPIEIHDTEHGTFALYNWRAAGVTYDDVKVYDLTPETTTPEVVGSTGDDDLVGTAAGEHILGLAGDDTLVGLAGDDRLEGGAGCDLYTWVHGDGNDTIVEAVAPGDSDTLVLQDVARGDVTFYRNGNDVTLVTADGATITLADQYVGGGVEVLVTDGGVLDRDSLTAALVNRGPEAGADALRLSETETKSIDLLANDRDADGDALSVTGLHVTTATGITLTPDQIAAAFHLANGAVRVDGSVFAGLDEGETATVTLGYDLVDERGAATTGTLTVTVDGYAAYNVITGGDAAETINGTAGRDKLIGGAGNDRLVAGDGDDKLDGGDGYDVLMGGAGNDILLGGADNDVLTGGAGKDRLVGGAGNDAQTGGAGSDTFVFNVGAGLDTVLDFKATGADHDIVELSKALFADYADLIASGALHDTSVGAVLDLGDDSSVTFVGLKAAAFIIDDFRFA